MGPFGFRKINWTLKFDTLASYAFTLQLLNNKKGNYDFIKKLLAFLKKHYPKFNLCSAGVSSTLWVEMAWTTWHQNRMMKIGSAFLLLFEQNWNDVPSLLLLLLITTMWRSENWSSLTCFHQGEGFSCTHSCLCPLSLAMPENFQVQRKWLCAVKYHLDNTNKENSNPT